MMFKFIHIDENEPDVTVEYTVNSDYWPTIVQHFNYFLAGCGFISHDNKVDYPFCEPNDVFDVNPLTAPFNDD